MTQVPTTLKPEVNDSEVAEIINKRVTHTPTGLIYSNDTTFEEWMKTYNFYSALKDRTSWLLGDCLRQGEKYGERYAQAIEITARSYSHLTGIVYVCSRFSDMTRRREHLPFSWHESVAALPPQTADTILDEAEKKQWTRDDVRDAAARAKGLPTRAEKEAVKRLAEETKVKLLPPAANPAVDVQATVTPAPRPLVWNGYPVTTEEGLIFAGDTVPLDDQEADRCAHEFGFKTAEDMVRALEASQKAQEHPAAVLSPEEPPKPAQSQPEPKTEPVSLPMEDQHVAMQRLEAALQRFLEAIREVDTTQIKKAKAMQLLREMVPVDDFMDTLSKLEDQPAATQPSLAIA